MSTRAKTPEHCHLPRSFIQMCLQGSRESDCLHKAQSFSYSICSSAATNPNLSPLVLRNHHSINLIGCLGHAQHGQGRFNLWFTTLSWDITRFTKRVFPGGSALANLGNK